MTKIIWDQKADLAVATIRAIEKYKIPFKEGDIPEISISKNSYVKRLYNAQTAVLTQDLKQVLLWYNRAAQDVFGHTPEEAIGKNSVDLLVPEHLRDERNQELERVLRDLVAVNIDTQRVHKSGELIDINAWVFPYELHPSQYSIAAIVRRI